MKLNEKEVEKLLEELFSLKEFVRTFILIFIFGLLFSLIFEISVNKINAGVWFCGNGVPMEDPCFGGKNK